MMIVRCTLGKGIRERQDPEVDRGPQAWRRAHINIISFYNIITNTSTIYGEVVYYIKPILLVSS